MAEEAAILIPISEEEDPVPTLAAATVKFLIVSPVNTAAALIVLNPTHKLLTDEVPDTFRELATVPPMILLLAVKETNELVFALMPYNETAPVLLFVAVMPPRMFPLAVQFEELILYIMFTSLAELEDEV